MKDFLKFTFASVIGVILAGVVFTILGIITLVGIVASSDTETVVKDNSIFVLDFKGSLSERVQENPLQQLLGEEFEAYGLDDILASIKKAKDNDKIKGIYIQPSYLEASYASLEEIRNALLDFKESGKFIVAYAAHQVCLEVQDKVASMTAPGVVCEDLYNAAIEIVTKAGFADRFMGVSQQARFIGHGIGLEINEAPVLAPRIRRELEEGMVFALEPKIVLPGVGPVGIENSWVVTENGAGKLTICNEEIIEL